jgi:hypothetical protein
MLRLSALRAGRALLPRNNIHLLLVLFQLEAEVNGGKKIQGCESVGTEMTQCQLRTNFSKWHLSQLLDTCNLQRCGLIQHDLSLKLYRLACIRESMVRFSVVKPTILTAFPLQTNSGVFPALGPSRSFPVKCSTG